MPEEKFTKDDVTMKIQIAKLEEKMDFLTQEFMFAKKIFWRYFAPVVSAMSAFGGFIATIYAKSNFFNHNN